MGFKIYRDLFDFYNNEFCNYFKKKFALALRYCIRIIEVFVVQKNKEEIVIVDNICTH